MGSVRQKNMAVINDLACYGRCAIAVAHPIISAMGIESCPLPTALLSTNGAFRGCVVSDMEEFMGKTIQHWEELGLSFDGICSGFYTSAAQMEQAKRLFAKADRAKTKIFIDPIMGDHGRRYSVTKEEVCKEYRNLLSYADVITPNLTECCELLEIPYPDNVPGEEKLAIIAKELAKLGPKQIVITGIERENQIENFIYDHGNCESVIVDKLGDARCGTGDVFMAVLSASMVSGSDLLEAVKKAADFLCLAIKASMEKDISWRNGVCFEECLVHLQQGK